MCSNNLKKMRKTKVGSGENNKKSRKKKEQREKSLFFFDSFFSIFWNSNLLSPLDLFVFSCFSFFFSFSFSSFLLFRCFFYWFPFLFFLLFFSERHTKSLFTPSLSMVGSILTSLKKGTRVPEKKIRETKKINRQKRKNRRKKRETEPRQKRKW